MRQIVYEIAKKELRHFGRDGRRVFFLVLFPALIYPLLFAGSAALSARGLQNMTSRDLTVVWSPPLPDYILSTLQNLDDVQLYKSPASENSKIDASVYLAAPEAMNDHGTVVVEMNGSTENGLFARHRILEPLRKASRTYHQEQLVVRGIEKEMLQPGQVWLYDNAPKENVGRFLFSRLIAPLLVMMIIFGVFLPSIEVTVGEREKRTLRTLLCAPVDRGTLLLGKVSAVATIGFAAAIINILGILIPVLFGAQAYMAFQLGFREIALLPLILFPLVIYVTVTLMAVASFTKTEQEAQTLLSPVILFCMLPAVLVAFPGFSFSWWHFLIPFFGPALCVREVLSGAVTTEQFVTTIAGALTFTGVMLSVAKRLFTIDAIMTGRVLMPSKQESRLEPFDALMLIIAMATTLLVSSAVLMRGPVPSNVAYQLLPMFIAFGILPLVIAVIRTRQPLKALGLTRSRHQRSASILPAAVLMIPGLVVGGQYVVQLLADPSEMESWSSLMEPFLLSHPVVLALSVVFFPAIFEETAFRGAIQRAFGLKPWTGIFVAAVAFGLFHGSVARFPSTFIVGVLAGAIAHRTGSTVTAMIFHAAYNASVLSIAMWGGTQTHVGGSPMHDQFILLAVAILSFSIGAVLFGRQLKGPRHD